MPAPATHATPQDDPGPHAADAQYYRQALHGLVDTGTDLARLLHAQAMAQAGAAPITQPAPHAAAPAPQAEDAQLAPTPTTPTPLVSLAAAFDQVARAVRRCIALARSLDAAPPNPARHRTAARKRILREVEDSIQRTAPTHGEGPDSADGLTAELRDRLDAPDLDADISSRPVADVIKDICRDLGLGAAPGTRPFKRRTPADLARLHARAAAPTRANHPGASPQPPRPEAPGPESPGPESPGPQPPSHGTAHPTPGPQPDGRTAGPGGPAATPLGRPAPGHPGAILPDDPAGAVALIQRHAAEARWRQPLAG